MANLPDRKEQKRLGLRKSRRWPWLVLTVGVAIGVGLVYIFVIDPNKIALTVGSKKYTKRELQKIVDEAAKNGVSRDEAVKKLTDYEKHKQVAAKLGVEPTNDQLATAGKAVQNDTKSKVDENSMWYKIIAYPSAIEAAISQAEAGYYAGTVFIFYFSRLIEPLSSSQTMTAEMEAVHRKPSAIAADRAYSQGRADYYYGELKAGRMTAPQVISAIKADNRLNPNGALNQSGEFTTSPDGLSFMGDGAAIKIGGGWTDSLPLISSTGLTDIKVGKVVQTDLPGNPQVDGNFYFVKVDSIKNPVESIRQQFDKEMKSL